MQKTRSRTFADVERPLPHRETKVNWYTLECALFATVGSLLYGIDSGIISTTTAQASYLEYFAPYQSDIAGAVVSTFTAGSFIGVLFAGWAADSWGRKRTIMFAAIWAIIAGAIQSGSVRVGMLIAGRILGGFAIGVLNMTIPIYNAEIAPPSKRGLISGLHGQFVSFGFATANWVGYLCSYAKGDFQWRFPFAVQCIPAIILLAGIWFLPFSPRWLLEQGRNSEALEVVKKLSKTEESHVEEITKEQFHQMQLQIGYEKENTKSLTEILASPRTRKRLLLAVLIQVFAQLSGVNVINYQTTLYKGVGITGHTVLLLAALFGMVGPVFNIVCLAFVDKWGRKNATWITGIAMGINIGLIMALTAKYANSTNKVGQGFTIAFIFCFSAIYSLGYNSIHYIYVPEILSQNIRARGSSVAACSNVLVNIVFNQISPVAFTHVGYKYYAVFVGTNIFGAIIVFFFFVETKGKSLEEINALFGDKVVDIETPPDQKDVQIAE